MSKHQSNQHRDERKQAAQQRIKEKVAILAKWESEGITTEDPNFFVPTSKAAFCRWEDEKLEEVVLIDEKETTVCGVFSFTDATLDKGYNSAHKERAVDLIDKLKNRRTKKGQNSEIKKLKAKVKEYEISLQNINNELVESRAENKELNALLSAKKLEVERLTKRLKNVEPLGPKGVV